VTARIANGFARMVFSFDGQVPSDVKLNGGVVVVTFARPVAMSIDALPSQLAGYVNAVRRDPDGRSIRFALSQRVTVNSMEAGERLFVDMMPDAWRGPPPGLPTEVVEELTRRAREAERRAQLAETARAARSLPPVVVRVGNHPTFTRFVFALPEPVGVGLDRVSDTLTIRIAKPFTFDLRQAREALPTFVSEIDADTSPSELTFKLIVSPQADVRAFREDNSYVLDLSMRGGAPTALPGPRSDSRIPSAAPPVTSLPGSQVTAPAMPAPQAPAALRLAANRDQPVETPAQASRPPRVEPAAGRPAEPAPAARGEPAPAATPRVTGGPAVVQARRAGDTIRILVPFTMETPGAVFQRADTLWLVFDARQAIDLSGLQAGSTGEFTSIDASRTREGTAIRIGLDRQSLASTSRDGMAWIITLADNLLEPPRPVQLERANDPANKLVASADFPNAGTVHRLSDPLAGDELVVVTGAGPARAFIRNFEMVEFHALAGSHGLVFQPLVDDLQVVIAGERVNVGRPQGLLALTAGNARQQSAVRPVRRARSIGFDPELWAADAAAPFRLRESELVANAAAVHETQRTAKRLDLVRFYMAQGRWPEAKSVIDTILRQDRRVAEDGSIHGLRSVVSVMMRRPQDAMRDLAHSAMATSPDAPLWRGTALAIDGRSRDAHEAFEAAEAPITTLPPLLARFMVVQAIGAALDVGAIDRAEARLNELQEVGVPPDAEQQYALLRGRVTEARGSDREAMTAYARAANGPDEPVRADAEQRRLAVRYRLGEIDRKAAAEELEIRSFAWRGDDVEARTLAMLARVYGEMGRFREAFATTRNAMKLFPRSEAVRGVQDDVTHHFEALFLDGNADQMKPIDALALYYDFREMTPQGRRGDEIIRRLADRLAGMDLLDQAASLLQHQVDRRLTGAARAQVATKLALFHLMNRKPAAALQSLRGTRLADLPEELRMQRYLLEARALADSGRPDQGLELLDDVRSPEGEILRADILWSAQRYRASAEQSEKWLSTRRAGAPLTEEERRHILRAAIGYALSDEPIGLDRLRTRWTEFMAKSPDERSFAVVTAPIEARGVEYREIAKSIADRDTLDAFLKTYRERYPTEVPAPQRAPTTQAEGAATQG
jgi:tetratricopeptide (TPR) repeat protein